MLQAFVPTVTFAPRLSPVHCHEFVMSIDERFVLRLCVSTFLRFQNDEKRRRVIYHAKKMALRCEGLAHFIARVVLVTLSLNSRPTFLFSPFLSWDRRNARGLHHLPAKRLVAWR